MSIFRKNQPPPKRKYESQGWDQRVCNNFFPLKAWAVKNRDIGSPCECVLTECEVVIQVGLPIREKYSGTIRIELSQDEYAEIAVVVEDNHPQGIFPFDMTDSPSGWGCFHGGIYTKSEIYCVINDIHSLSSQLSHLFTRVKSQGGNGVKMKWRWDLTNMLDMDVEAAFGNWETDSPRDENGTLVEGKFPGRRAFAFKELIFSAVL